jgi:hypothetical protein
MQMPERIFPSYFMVIAAAALIYLVVPVKAQAASLYWVCGSDLWNNASCWSLTAGGTGGAGEPQSFDDAYLIQSDSTDRTVTYQTTLSTYPWTLRIDATGTGAMTLSQSQDSLSMEHEYIGVDGVASYNQSGGTNTVTHMTSWAQGSS